jgi:pimeloyl-ACP methyl ester carboxylesterase
VPKGSFILAAFEDQNNNLAYDKPEPAGYFGSPDLIVVSPEQLALEGTKGIKDLIIQLNPSDEISSDFPTSLDGVTFIPKSFIKLGAIADLDDTVFDSENGDTGYWKPLTFLRNFGIGVYFIEPYDPDKIPVLFVHGATGTPRPWEAIVEQLDREKYQPWFFYYPSGLRLDRLGFALNNIVKALHQDYGFNTLYVTAHSMGGLVSRSFILNSYNDKQDYIKLFVSISTPWNGHRATAKGVEQAPAVVPSWYDMIPDSEFIQSLFIKELPPFTKYYLFFSFKGDCSFMMANNDGSVELSSELDPRAQADASRIFGYDEDHTAILASQNVINQYNLILESMENLDIH